MNIKPNPFITAGITHGSKAHHDDFIFACLFCAIYPELTLYRADEIHKEWLNSPSVIVRDTGGQYDEQLNNFDHHHDKNLSCGAVLYLESLGLKEQFFDAFNGGLVFDVNDTSGLQGVSKVLGLPNDEENIKKYAQLKNDIISESMIAIFSRKKELKKGSELHLIMSEIGKNIIDRCEQINDQHNLFDRDVYFKNISGVDIAFCDRIDPSKILFGWDSWTKKRNLKIDIVYSKDSRTEGNYRLISKNQNKINFAKYIGNGKYHFIHQSGFLLSALKEDIDSSIELIIEKSKV